MRSPAVIVVDGNRITAVNPDEPLPDSATEIDLGDVTLLPGLMDMELNLLIGGPGGPEGLPSPMHGVQDDPAYRTLRGAVNARTTLRPGFTTVRNLGPDGQDRRLPARRGVAARDRPGLASGPADLPGRARGHPVRRAPGSHGVPAPGARHHAAVASPRASPTACPTCRRACATRSATARS